MLIISHEEPFELCVVERRFVESDKICLTVIVRFRRSKIVWSLVLFVLTVLVVVMRVSERYLDSTGRNGSLLLVVVVLLRGQVGFAIQHQVGPSIVENHVIFQHR